MEIKLTRENGYEYRTQNGELVSFKECTLGKYKGKLFMLVYSESNGGKSIKTEYLLEVVKQNKYYDKSIFVGNSKVRILEEIEVDEHKYSQEEVFFNEARKAEFAIENGTAFEGYTFNQYWNGWDRPYFTKEIALEICKEFSSEEFKCFYDEKNDTFFSEDDESVPNKEEIGTPTEINTPEGKLQAYDFGCAGWIWEEKQKIKEN